LIELRLNSIRNILKALTENEISEVEFENIISQVGTYIKFDEVFPEKNV